MRETRKTTHRVVSNAGEIRQSTIIDPRELHAINEVDHLLDAEPVAVGVRRGVGHHREEPARAAGGVEPLVGELVEVVDGLALGLGFGRAQQANR